MSGRKAEISKALTLLTLVIFGFYQTTTIDLTFSSELELFTGPRAYPRLLLCGMLLLVVIHLGNLVLRSDNAINSDVKVPMHPRLSKVILALFVLILFTSIFELLGYLLAIVPLIVTISFLNGANHIIKTCFFAVLISLICLIVFRYSLNTVLPEGVLGIDQIF
ncbi:tripartite tricarboxylate transporter TctB family protein [Granulosicoccus sp.]|nr:tripartite tricarboxylate transporter TctB family protein [Granulosicoccus sp.]